jgi:hypothetical protein
LPNDIGKFDGLVDTIKIAGRNFPLEQWHRVIDSYQKRSGNVRFGDLLSTTGDQKLSRILVNQISDLGFNELTKNCKTVCGIECDHCDKVYKQITRNFV